MFPPQLAKTRARTLAQALLLIAASIPLLLAVPGCTAAPSPYVTTVGALRPGTTLTVRAGDTTVNVYAPEASQKRTLFTISATALPQGTPPPPPRIRPAADGAVVVAPNRLASLLVRVPDLSNLALISRHGDVNVTDIAGNADVVAGAGNVVVMLPGYAQVSVLRGNISATMGAVSWPGTLRFSTQHGDITLWINPKAPCAVHLHTDDGTLFSDFGLRGTANGNAETIDGILDGGGPRGIDVEAASGSIRLLRLQPQA